MRRARGLRSLIGAVFIAVASPAGAQTFDLGVKGGVAVTSVPLAGEVFDQVVDQDSRDSSSKLGVNFGGYIGFPLANRLSFQPEALFVMKGVKLNETSGGSFSARLYYLDVPLLVRFRASPNSQRPVYLFGGPTFGIKLGSSATLESPSQTLDVNINPALKTLDIGLTFGSGIEHRRFLFEARFTAGITDIAAASYPHPDPLRNRTILMMVGVKLR